MTYDTWLISHSVAEPGGLGNGIAASSRDRDSKSGTAGNSRAGSETAARQPVREPKAFTGRGSLVDDAKHVERKLRAAVDRVHSELRQLSEQTREVPGRRFYLMVQKRARVGAVFLRWRDTGGQGGHVPWHRVPEFIAREPVSLHAWYERINRLAMELNDEEQLCRLRLSLYLRRQARLRGDDSLEPKLGGRANGKVRAGE